MTEKYDLSGPDPERPLMMIRLSAGHAEPKIWDRLFPVLKQNRACCDEVWFSTGVGVPPPKRRSFCRSGKRPPEPKSPFPRLIPGASPGSRSVDVRKIGIIFRTGLA
jgi:hypothetical protein